MIAPAFLLLVFFALQAGFYFYGRTVAVQSAREGVSQLRLAEDPGAYAAMQGSVSSAVVRHAAEMGGVGLTSPQMTSAYDDANGRVSVTVTGGVVTLVPGLTMRVSADASGTVERFRDPVVAP